MSASCSTLLASLALHAIRQGDRFRHVLDCRLPFRVQPVLWSTGGCGMLFLLYVMIRDLVVMVRFYMGVRLAALWVVWASPPVLCLMMAMAQLSVGAARLALGYGGWGVTSAARTSMTSSGPSCRSSTRISWM